MPIQVVHGGYGSFENAKYLHGVTSDIAQQEAARKDAEFKQKAYLGEVERENRRLDQRDLELKIRAAQYVPKGQRDQTALEAQQLGQDAQAIGEAGMMAVPPNLGTAIGLHAAFGIAPSELGLEPGKDYEDIINDRALELMDSPGFTPAIQKQLHADLVKAQEAEKQRAELGELAGRADDMVQRFGQTAGDQWLQEAQQLHEDIQQGAFSSPKAAADALQELRQEGLLNEKRAAANQAVMSIAGEGKDKMSDAEIAEMQQDIRKAKTTDDLDGIAAEALIRGSIDKEQLDAYNKRVAEKMKASVADAAFDAYASSLPPDPYPRVARDLSLSQMSTEADAMIRERNGMPPKESLAPWSDATPTEGKIAPALMEPAAKAALADEIRMILEQDQAAKADPKETMQKVRARLTQLGVHATPSDVIELLKEGNSAMLEAGKQKAEARKNSPKAVKNRKMWGGVRN